jgi:hypothetical protein
MFARVTTVLREDLDPLQAPSGARRSIGLVDRRNDRVRLITLQDSAMTDPTTPAPAGGPGPASPSDPLQPQSPRWPDSATYEVALADYDDRACTATVTTVDAEPAVLRDAIAWTRTGLMPHIRQGTSSCLGLLVLVDQGRRDVLSLTFWSTTEPDSPGTVRHDVVFGH